MLWLSMPDTYRLNADLLPQEGLFIIPGHDALVNLTREVSDILWRVSTALRTIQGFG
jgi:hypothetical protein